MRAILEPGNTRLNMRRLRAIAVFFACALALVCRYPAAAQPAARPIKLPPLAGWKLRRVASPPVSSLLREFGLRRRFRMRAVRGAAAFQLQADLFHDSSGAFGAYSFRRPAAASRPLGSCQLTASPRSLALACDRWLVRAQSPHKFSPASFARIVAWSNLLPVWHAPRDLPPSLPAFAPRQARLPGSLRYCYGPVGWRAALPWAPLPLAGFQYSPEIVAAGYAPRLPRNNAAPAPSAQLDQLGIISYPTPQIAADRLARFRTALARSRPAVQLRRSGTFLLLVRGGATAAATALIAGIHDRELVTWNQPPPINVGEVAEMLVGILVLAGSLMLVALVVGVLSGWLHAQLARWFPKRFTTRGRDLIQLNLN